MVWTFIYHRQSTNQKVKFSTVMVKYVVKYKTQYLGRDGELRVTSLRTTAKKP
jgi:hypothetical protein